MTPHINAKDGAFAKTVLMPGDPLRAKLLADTFLENAELVTDVRNIYGYTGTYKGVPVSVMASGMGMPSIGIYSWELFSFYGVENIIRIGSAGSYTLNEGTIGSAGKLSDSVLTTYYIRPKYSYQQTSSTGILGSNSNEYMEKWELDQPIYLMLTTESLAATHNPGMYYSNVYFTLVYK